MEPKGYVVRSADVWEVPNGIQYPVFVTPQGEQVVAIQRYSDGVNQWRVGFTEQAVQLLDCLPLVREYKEPEELRKLRAEVNDLRGQLSNEEATVAELTDMLERNYEFSQKVKAAVRSLSFWEYVRVLFGADPFHLAERKL